MLSRMTRTTFTAIAVALVLAFAGCTSSHAVRLTALDDPASTQTTGPPVEPLFDPTTTTSTTAAPVSTTSTSQLRSDTPGSPLSAPTSVPSTQTAPTTSTTAGAPLTSQLSAAGGHMEMTDRSGWRTLDGSCTVTDEAAGRSFGFTPDPACYDPATGTVPVSQWPTPVPSVP